MEFWDSLYETVKNAASVTAKKAGEFSDVAKIKFELMREKAKLEDAYKHLGELYYNQIKSCNFDDSKIALAYDKIEKSVIEIERLTKLVANKDALTKQSNCHQNTDKNTSVCPKCGKRLSEKKPTDDK